ncbi:RNA polymerase sigma factor [Paenibacillus sp. GCM10027629]|uniref:RNA polymerase sigma factor n=1 Tax=Paenibacillus sp. GCM10027629 TaxID=3273414 RepID=UPI0036331BE8
MMEMSVHYADRSKVKRNRDFMEEVAPYLDELRSYCIYVAASTWEGEDLYQEVLLKAFVYRNKVCCGTVPFTKAYLYRMAQNIWVDMYRKHRGRIIPCEQIEVGGVDSNRYVEVRELVEHVADQVPERHMEMFLMQDVFRYSMEEIAVMHNISVPAVKSALHRTRTKLRSPKRPQHTRPKDAKHPSRVERWVYAVLKGDPSKMLSNVSQG